MMPFGEVPIQPSRKGHGGSGWAANVKSLYNDPFKWQLVKSWVFFGVGVVVARELAAVDLSAPPTPNV